MAERPPLIQALDRKSVKIKQWVVEKAAAGRIWAGVIGLLAALLATAALVLLWSLFVIALIGIPSNSYGFLVVSIIAGGTIFPALLAGSLVFANRLRFEPSSNSLLIYAAGCSVILFVVYCVLFGQVMGPIGGPHVHSEEEPSNWIYIAYWLPSLLAAFLGSTVRQFTKAPQELKRT